MASPRAVLLLTVALVLAGVPGAAGASPTATAADAPHQTASLADAAPIAPDRDATRLASGEPYWQGQRLRVDASRVGGTLELWLVAASGQLSHRLRTLEGENGTVTLDTAALSGRYVFLVDGAPVYVHEGEAYGENPPNGGAVTVAQSAFRVKPQGLSAEWADQTVYPGQAAILSVESNRSASVAALSADGLSFQNLTTLVPADAYADDYDARANDSELLVDLGARTTLRLNTAPFEAGNREVHLDVVDTTAATTAVLTVRAPGDAAITSITRTEQVGDAIDLNVSCGGCFLVVGGPEQGLIDVVELEDADGDGTVTMRVNTRYAGIARAQADFPNDVRAYPSATDTTTRYASSAELVTTNEELLTSTSRLSDLRTDLDVPANGRTAPLEPGRLRLTVATSDYLLPRRDYGDRAPYGGRLVVVDQTDVETVQLEPRALDGLTSLGAPPGTGATAAELTDVAGPRDRVALGDRLVFRLDVSGVFGYLAAHGTSRETLAYNREEGLDLRLERVTADGTEVVPLKQTASRLVTDPASDRLYLVVRTGGTGRTRLQAGEYRARFTLSGVSGSADGYHANTETDGYPYLAPGEEVTVTTTATLAPPTATIRRPVAGSGPNVTDAKTLPVEGTSSVAPGAGLTIVATAADYAWEERRTARVDSAGNFSAALDFSDAPGREFDVAVVRDGAALANASYTVYPPATPASGNGTATNETDASSGGGTTNASTTGTGSSQSLAVDLPVIGTVGLPSIDLSMLTGLAVPAGAGLGGLVVVYLLWRFVIKRVVLS